MCQLFGIRGLSYHGFHDWGPAVFSLDRAIDRRVLRHAAYTGAVAHGGIRRSAASPGGEKEKEKEDSDTKKDK